MDDDAVDAAGQRRRRRATPTRSTSRVEAGPGLAWVVAERVEAVFGKAAPDRAPRPKGSELVGRPYHGPFDQLPAQAEVRARA